LSQPIFFSDLPTWFRTQQKYQAIPLKTVEFSKAEERFEDKNFSSCDGEAVVNGLYYIYKYTNHKQLGEENALDKLPKSETKKVMKIFFVSPKLFHINKTIKEVKHTSLRNIPRVSRV